ncbi:MAG: methyltransferase domain-containing protein [Thermoplasmatales archaeon]|nr:methyltransferase domain-containing protein [Thermoplasmatales archaeon]MCW6170878.1 methyltransferase domain-containing protein [Thermoplasmatales archaeon]
MTDYHDFFSKNVDYYTKSKSHRSGEDLSMLLEALNVSGDSVGLDLATGTGNTAIEIAKIARMVYGLDGTQEMLDSAIKSAYNLGLSNIEFVLGSVEHLPFGNETFDLVSCRRAAHHFKDKSMFLDEVRRVLKVGGKFGLVDFVRPENDTLNLFNRIETMRDPSHVAALRFSEWDDMVKNHGFKVLESQLVRRSIPFGEWLSPVSVDSEAGIGIQKLLRSVSASELEIINFDLDAMEIKKDYLILTCAKVND